MKQRLAHVRRSLVVAAAACAVYLPVDASHARGVEIVAWRLAWIAVLAAAALAQDARRPARAAGAAYAAAAASAVATLGIFRAAGGSAHPAFGFVLALPLAVQVLVPELPWAAALTGAVTAVGGTLMLVAEGRPPRDVGEWALVSVTLSALAVTGAVGFRRTWLRELRAERERNAALERLAVAERLATAGRLSAAVAHEINNPLAYISSNLRWAIERLATAPSRDDDVVEALADAETGARRVHGIVSDLGMFGRARAEGRSGLVDLHRVLDATLTLAASDVRHRARLVRDLAEVPPVLGDEARLAQVFLSLLANAVDGLPHDAAGAHVVSVRLAREDASAVVEVSDSGSPLEAEHLPRVFDPFFTADGRGRAAGLGLPLAKRVIEEMGGAIDVRSAAGEGTTFRVTLPLAG